jgi:type II secretory pathway component PulM
VRAALRKAWEARSPLERTVIAVLAAVLGATLYIWLLQSAERSRQQLRTSVAALRTQAVLLDRQAAEHQLLRASPASPASPTDLRALVQARADAARLSGVLTRIETLDADHVQVVFGALPFADWLSLVAALQAQHVSIDAARVEALAAPGMVSATATLSRAKAQ